jgi:hypothetical protein
MRIQHFVPVFLLTAPVLAQTTFHGPFPYLSTADVPAGFFGGPHVVETFEDESADFGLALSPGGAIGPSGNTDSVDGDDGLIDGSGKEGHSWFSSNQPVTITLPRPVREAGVVWTDGPAGTGVTFEAFGPGMVSLGVIGPFQHADNSHSGTTAEDRFYGATDPNGIVAIRLSSVDGNHSIELDHVQFSALADPYCSPAVPNSTGLPGRIAALGSLVVSDGDLVLYADQLPPAQFGYFLVAANSGSVTPPGSQGVLCLSGAIGRYGKPGQVLQGPAGSLQIDLSALPLSGGKPVLPGETWRFQCWYRDSGTNNFTDAVALTFH